MTLQTLINQRWVSMETIASGFMSRSDLGLSWNL